MTLAVSLLADIYKYYNKTALIDLKLYYIWGVYCMYVPLKNVILSEC